MSEHHIAFPTDTTDPEFLWKFFIAMKKSHELKDKQKLYEAYELVMKREAELEAKASRQGNDDR
jgi:hypothetical protein